MHTPRLVIGFVFYLFSALWAFAEIRISTSDNWQAIIDANSAGTTYRIESGEHRLQSCIPKDGDTLIGDFGAYMKGSKLLDSDSAVQSSGLWIFAGQTQNEIVYDDGLPRATQIGNELFLDGVRLLHVDSRAEVDAAGECYFDAAADEIVMYDDPTGRKVEAVVEQTAINLNGLSDVSLINFTIMHYGSVLRPEGAVQARRSDGVLIQYMEFRDNHSVGLGLGPNMLVEHTRFYSQGQMGASGGGQIDDGPLLPITIRNCEFFENYSIQEDWQTSGAEGAVKITYSAGSVFENCWVHDNWGFGVWYDIDNEGTIIRSNLIENTGSERRQSRGVFFEISGNANDPSAATSQIYWNTFRSITESSIDISSSSNVDVFENAIIDAVFAVTVRDALRGQRNSEGFLEDVAVYENQVEASKALGRVSDASESEFGYIRLWDENSYFGQDDDYAIDAVTKTRQEWLSALGYDANSSWQNAGTPALPEESTAFSYSHYGPRLWEHDFQVSLDEVNGTVVVTFLSLKEMGILERSYAYRTDLSSAEWLPITPSVETVIDDLGDYERVEARFSINPEAFFLSLSYTGL